MVCEELWINFREREREREGEQEERGERERRKRRRDRGRGRGRECGRREDENKSRRHTGITRINKSHQVETNLALTPTDEERREIIGNSARMDSRARRRGRGSERVKEGTRRLARREER